MKIQLVDKGAEGELMLEGRLDANSSPEAEKIFLQMSERYSKLTLNLAGLEYISSAGLRVLKVTHMTMRKKGGVLALKNTGKMVMEVFEMTGFAGLLHFE